jgi:hypothetical protein
VVDYLSGEEAAATGAPPTSMVLAIDATLEPPLQAALADNLLALLHALPPATHLILLAFDAALSVFDLGSATPCATTYPGERGWV